MNPDIHPEAFDLIVRMEVTSKAVYERRYMRPIWPGGMSGVTIGIGWDCGHNNRADLDREWPSMAASDRDTLTAVLGLTGEDARVALEAVQSVIVPWDAAIDTFRDHALPRFLAQTLTAFPGCEALPDRCVGSLLSLVYNRGPGTKDKAGDRQERRREMRVIRDLIAAGTPEGVPDQIRAMKRLWVGVGGLLTRRDLEAELFQRGLADRDRKAVA